MNVCFSITKSNFIGGQSQLPCHYDNSKVIKVLGFFHSSVSPFPMSHLIVQDGSWKCSYHIYIPGNKEEEEGKTNRTCLLLGPKCPVSHFPFTSHHPALNHKSCLCPTTKETRKYNIWAGYVAASNKNYSSAIKENKELETLESIKRPFEMALPQNSVD